MFEIGSQLPLFIFPAEIYDDEILNDWASCDLGDMGDLRADKFNDCSGYFIDDILRHGVRVPACLNLYGNGVYVGNGHHRLAVAVEYDLVLPVVFDDRDIWGKGMSDSQEFPDSGRTMDDDDDDYDEGDEAA